MDFIPDSDDEGVQYCQHRHSQPPQNSLEGGDFVGSDDEVWHSEYQLADATPQVAPQTQRFQFGRKPTLTAAMRKTSAQRPAHRRLVSSAAAEAQAAAPTAAEPSSAGQGSLSEGFQPGPTILRQPSFMRTFLVSGPPAFIGRQPLPPSRPTPAAAAPQAVRNDPSQTGQPSAGPGAPSGGVAQPAAPRISAPLMPSAGPSSRAASLPSVAASTGGGGSGIATHCTDDGLQVMYRTRHKRDGEEDDQGVKKKARAAPNSGWGNNFVRIDLKKGRGSTKFRASRHSTTRRRPGRGRWKTQRLRQVGDGSEFMEGWDSRGGSACFKCGGKGHWAKDCPGVEGPAEELSEEENEASNQATIAAGGPPRRQVAPVLAASMPIPPAPAEINVEEACELEALQSKLHRSFGFSAFRGLQVATIQQVLRGEPCLSIMPTGMGKSLCYQLPALLLPGLTLVVSPLIALMHDQCKAAPKELNPAVMWSGQSLQEARQVLKNVEVGAIRLLFVSPERLSNPYLVAALQPRMPLALVVIDEAHCVAEWGHSFRPAYFRLGEVLHRDISARSVLALTATATKATEAAVCSVLRIPPPQVLRDSAIRQNLRLHVRRSGGTPSGAGSSSTGWQQIVRLFKGPLASARSTVVYCAWKGDADSLAGALVTAGVVAQAYHAGRNLKERATVEAAFAAGRLRVVVATVAFGMGVDISSVDAVVHATMPRSLEEYVQQIGRAGRDGSEAQCHAFLSDADFISLRSLAYSGVVAKEGVRSVLSSVFSSAQRDEEEENTSERSFGVLPCRKLAATVDMQEENIESVLGYLEADEEPYLRVLPKVSAVAKVSFYAAAPEDLVEEHPIVRAVLLACPRPRNGLYSVSTPKLAGLAGKPPGAALQELQVMAHRKLIGFELSSDQGPAFEVMREPEDVEALADEIHTRLDAMLRCQVSRLDTAYRSLASAVVCTEQQQQEAALREALDGYFAQEEAVGAVGGQSAAYAALEQEGLPLRVVPPTTMLQTAQAVARRNKEQGGSALLPLSLARLLSGTGSPAMPRNDWAKRMGAFWGSLRDVDFPTVACACKVALRSGNGGGGD